MQESRTRVSTFHQTRLDQMDKLGPGLISDDLRKQIVNKVQRKYGWEQHECETAIVEFLKFLSLALSAPPSFIQVNEELDEIWHTCILQTEDYAKLCDQLSPGNFLHHKSERYAEYSEGIDTERLIEESVSWTINYIERFGEFTPETIKYWIFPNHLHRQLGWKMDEINSLKSLQTAYPSQT